MEWQVEFYTDCDGNKPVKEWLISLNVKARAKVLRNISLLEKFGLDVKEPFVKPLENKLFEVRAKDSEGIYRVIYFAHTGRKFILLHGFIKKTQKTPRKEIEIATKRMEEIIK